MNLGIISQFIDANKIGGWVRAGVAAGFVAAIAKWPILGAYVDPAVQVQIAAVAASIIVGAWSQLTKTDDAKLRAVEAMPDVANVRIKPTATDGAAAAAADPSRPKVTTT